MTKDDAVPVTAERSLSQTPATPMVQEGLREALEPFASILDVYDPADEDDATPATLVVGSVTDYSLTLGDLRAARRALSATPAKEGEGDD